MKILKEQQDKKREIEEELRNLTQEFETVKREYQRKCGVLHHKGTMISSVNRYDFKEAIQAICYLVSLVEGREYTYHEKELPIMEYISGCSELDFGWAYISPEFYDSHSKIKVQYICSDAKAALEEIDAVINEANAMGVSIYNDKPLPKFYELLTKPAKNYVQINIHNGHSDFFKEMNGCIEFICNDDFAKDLPITLININSKICDPNYMYIVDFMNYLAIMKMEKEDFTLSVEEMLAYARDFAEEVKSKQSGQSNKVLKKVVVEV